MRTTLVVLATITIPLAAAAHGRAYTQSNAAAGNEVLIFDRADDGALTPIGQVPTGGRGSGGGLGSQGALAFAEGGLLLAVNAGSDDVSVLAIGRHGLRLVGRAPSGGKMPVSVATHGDQVYVLDAGGDGDVSGFRLDESGALTPTGIHPLANRAPGPAQVAFAPSGETLVVTEKATNCIDTFAIEDGALGAASCHPAAGQTPFGFAFAPTEYDWFGNHYDRLVVSEAFGGAPDAATLSTYLVVDGALVTLAPTARTEQTAACWVALTQGGRFAYSTNTGSGSVTGFRLHADGALDRLAPDGRSGDTGGPDSKPIDAASAGGFLYVLDSGTHAISIFRARADGTLVAAGSVSGLPVAAAGLLAR